MASEWRRETGRRSAWAGAFLCAAATACAPAPELVEVDPVPAAPVAVAPEPVTRQIPYEGAFGPPNPPDAPLPAMQKPLNPWVKEVLRVWYQRPSPTGPEPIPLANPKAIYVEGKGPVIQILPGPPVFPDKMPERLKVVFPEKIPFSNNVKPLPRGEVRLVAVDRTLNDTKITRDSMAIEATFTDAEGAEWRIEQVTLAPISPNPVLEPWFGGLAIDTLYHGDTGNGTPAVPKVNCAMCSWGWADIYKNDKRVASSALLHVMVTSDARDNSNGFKYYGYDVSDRPVREVHLVVPPSAYLPSPGGYLHIMWENAEVKRGTPQQIAAMAPELAEEIPTIELSAVPYLKWDKTEIPVQAGKKYRLIVHNNDPSSFHQFSLHSTPESGEHHGGAQDIRHDHGAAGGGTGPLWKPGDAGPMHKGEDPPAPRDVFFPLPQGSTWATMVMFEKPGEYEFMCPVANHYRRGMEGKFIVSASSSTGGAQ